MKARLFFLFYPLWLASQAMLGQTINTNYLRRDETLQYDEVALRFSAVCQPTAPPTRTLGLALDRVRFLDSRSNALFSIDVGTAMGSYYLGEGWYASEASGTNFTWCWANGLAPQSVIYCPIPFGSSFVEFTCATPWTTACSPINTEVRANGYICGSFALPPNSGWKTCLIPLPQQIPRHLDYTLLEGGPIALSSIDWINTDGAVVSSLPTVCGLTGAGSTASFSAAVPAGVGDFQLRLAVPALVQSRLRVSVNNSSALILHVPAGSNWVSSAESDALERQADKRTRSVGWGEDFNARKSGVIWTWPNIRYTPLDCDGDALKMSFLEGESSVQLTVLLPEALRISEFPYLSVKLRASKGTMYFVRPAWYDDQNRYVPLWFEEAPTDDRVGTGDWETLTVSLPQLVRMGGSPATMVSAIDFPLVKGIATNATLEIDWVRVHNGFLPDPENQTSIETNFSNHLDDDGDGKTGKDDQQDYASQTFAQPLVLAFNYLWFGSPYSTSGNWLGWYGEKMDFSNLNQPPMPLGIVYNPDTTDPLHPGKRNICSVYYPLNFRDHLDYVPPANNNFQYDLFGGLEQYDCRNSVHVGSQIDLAARYGIDGFVPCSGGKTWVGSWLPQMEITLASLTNRTKPFWLSVDYNNYYRFPPFNLLEEEPDYLMALDFLFFARQFGSRPHWLQYRSRPVVFASFLSELIDEPKWERAEQITVAPGLSAFDGLLNPGVLRAGFGNRLILNFSAAEQPGQDQRFLSVVFDYIRFLDTNLNDLTTLDFGTSSARPHLLSGWSFDEIWADGRTMVWAEGTNRQAEVEVAIPSDARFMEVNCYSFPETNLVTMRCNEGGPTSFVATHTLRSFYFRLGGLSPQTNQPAGAAQRPFALFLSSPEAAGHFDGHVSYGSYLRSSACIVSDPHPTILTVACGYDDRKIRYPGNFVDRENGALYRRQWEAALAGEPDVVMINTWNEWAEGTMIEPTVEFGYKYLELTLTYSLVLHRKLVVSPKPSAIDLTVKKYEVNPDGQSQIRLSASNQGIVVFTNLPCDRLVSFQALCDGSPFNGFTLNPTNATLTLSLLNTAAEYRVVFVRDAVPPVGSVRINGGAAYTDTTNVVLSLVASDNRGTVAGSRYSNDGSNWMGWEGYTTNKLWSLTAGDGSKTVFVQFKDDMGNIATCSASITVGRCWFESIGRRSNGVVDLKFTGALGGRYRIDAATNLGAWFPLMMVTNTTRTITNADQSATSSQRRFYRAVQQ